MYGSFLDDLQAAYIFVHIESNDILERYFSLLVQFYQRFVHA